MENDGKPTALAESWSWHCWVLGEDVEGGGWRICKGGVEDIAVPLLSRVEEGAEEEEEVGGDPDMCTKVP